MDYTADDRLVECVPNFCTSDHTVRKLIVSAIEAPEQPKCRVLDATSDPDTNRTICTFIGPPEQVVKAALAAARVAHERIDMRKHKGTHPRIGALDVCPFVPLWNIKIEDCKKLAKEFADSLAKEHKVPVYFYAASHDPSQPHRRTIEQHRQGEYEGLQEKLKDEKWKPDRGPAEFNAQWGATVTGARNQLITFNVNLLASKEHARNIAQYVEDELKSVTARGWYLEDADMAQVCTTLSNLEKASMHTVFEKCCARAEELKLAIVGSEVHGLVPLDSLLKAAKFYMGDELFALHEKQKVRLAIDRLRLSNVSEFKPEEKILEYKLKLLKEDGRWLKNVRQFVETIASWHYTPSAGSVTAIIASLGAALGTTVGLMTFGKKKFSDVDAQVRTAIEPLHSAMQELMPFIDKDAEAVAEYVRIRKLKEEERKREDLDDALQVICDIPFKIMKIASGVWQHMETIAQCGNIDVVLNAEVGARSLDAAIQSAASLIRWNLKKLETRRPEYCKKMSEDVEKMSAESPVRLQAIVVIMNGRKAAHNFDEFS